MQGQLTDRLQMKRVTVEHIADAVIFLGMLVNVIIVSLIVYYFVL